MGLNFELVLILFVGISYDFFLKIFYYIVIVFIWFDFIVFLFEWFGFFFFEEVGEVFVVLGGIFFVFFIFFVISSVLVE